MHTLPQAAVEKFLSSKPTGFQAIKSLRRNLVNDHFTITIKSQGCLEGGSILSSAFLVYPLHRFLPRKTFFTKG